MVFFLCPKASVALGLGSSGPLGGSTFGFCGLCGLGASPLPLWLLRLVWPYASVPLCHCAYVASVASVPLCICGLCGFCDSVPLSPLSPLSLCAVSVPLGPVCPPPSGVCNSICASEPLCLCANCVSVPLSLCAPVSPHVPLWHLWPHAASWPSFLCASVASLVRGPRP